MNSPAFDRMLHQPDRPAWQCPTCVEPWPCAPYRAYVMTLYRDPIDRGMHMGGFWEFAIIELPKPERPGQIHQRFFGWIKEPVEAAPVRGRPPGL